MMRIADFSSERVVADEADLETALAKRYAGDANAFWLWHDDGEFPALSILIKADIAYLHYFPQEGHAGFRPVGGVAGLPDGGSATFLLGPSTDDVEVLNDAVVPVPTALKVARDFFRSK